MAATTVMSEEEKQSFMAGLHVGVLAIPRDGVGPLTVPVWYDYEPGGQLWFLTGRESLKGRLLSTGVRISMCAQTEDPPYKYVSVEGPVVSLAAADGEGLPMAVRYLGERMGAAYHTQAGGAEDILVRVRPERWLAVDYSKANPLG